MTPASTPAPLIGFGQVRHTRLRPARNAFAYPTYFLMLPLRSLHRRLGSRRSAGPQPPRGAELFRRDHGDGRAPMRCSGWTNCWQREGITDATAKPGCTATRGCWATPSSR
jgi:DUF1365 family protein